MGYVTIMTKPPYELAHLQLAVIQCDINIAAMQKGIDDELKHRAELQEWIRQHAEYLKQSRENLDGNNI